MVNQAHIDAIEELILVILVVLEYLDILEHLLIDGDLVVVSDGILSKEVEHKLVRRLQRDVFTAERATADGVCLILALLVTRTKRKSIDEVHRRGALTVCHDLALQIS